MLFVVSEGIDKWGTVFEARQLSLE
jgi:hypothetical protein